VIEVSVVDDASGDEVDAARWQALALAVLEAEGVRPDAELSVSFVDETAMADLNRRFRDAEGPTDVLAFPMDDGLVDEAEVDGDAEPDGPPALVGDVVVCPTVARRQAPAHAGIYEDEIALLVVHGILHLMGMDHEEDGEAAAMAERERVLLGRFHSQPGPRQPAALNGTRE